MSDVVDFNFRLIWDSLESDWVSSMTPSKPCTAPCMLPPAVPCAWAGQLMHPLSTITFLCPPFRPLSPRYLYPCNNWAAGDAVSVPYSQMHCQLNMARREGVVNSLIQILAEDMDQTWVESGTTEVWTCSYCIFMKLHKSTLARLAHRGNFAPTQDDETK